MTNKKLIEVALPLEKINAESAREKSIRHGHPSTLHLWWARRPLAAARAVIWSSLVDDPSSHPELFPSEQDQVLERKRLFKVLEDLVVWENSNDERVLHDAQEEILKWTGNNPPSLLDPFAGGGAIPLEAERLDLKAIAHDLNPVAVTINKAMIEIPARFANVSPVHPEERLNIKTGWSGTAGLAEDISFYGNRIKEEAFSRIGHLYPKVKVPNNGKDKSANVIAWIWSRTVKCPNPACGKNIPLLRSYTLAKKKNVATWIAPIYRDGVLGFDIHYSGKPDTEGTVNRKGAICPFCNTAVDFPYIREEGKLHRIGNVLAAIVAEGDRGRSYILPDAEQELAAQVEKPSIDYDAELPFNPRDFKTPNYGLNMFSDLFTPRQLIALGTLSELISDVQTQIEFDAVQAGMEDDHISLSDGGTGAKAYGQAIGVYLSFVVDKMVDYHSSICSWHSSKELIRNTFGRQAIPMVWDYAEANPFSNSAGCFDNMLEWVVKSVVQLPYNREGSAEQFDAQSDCGLRNLMISTDPPYYDNIGYADLSDFFYIWMRQSLKETYPSLFRTMLVPKAEELIATPYRHDGSAEQAKEYFEKGMLSACRRFYEYTRDDIPVTIYYAYKQADTDGEGDEHASSGWETMLNAIIEAGFMITGTWPMRTEMANRTIASGSNALASSIVLVCRKRKENAGACTRRNFINELKRELRPALQNLQSSNIAPVDLAQSAIGPGIGVFSKYQQVLEADGNPMAVRSALQIINQELDLYFNEQDGELDAESRFCVDLYSQMAFNEMIFGDANTLATAKNTSIAIMASHGTVFAQKGKVHLIERPELPDKIDEHGGSIWLLCQQLTYKMEKAGVEGCATSISNMYGSNAERAKDLAYRLYTIAERKKWAQEAYAYNALVVAWPEIQSRAAELKAIVPQQLTLEDFMNNNN